MLCMCKHVPDTVLWILYSSHELQVVPVGGEVKDHVITIMSLYDVIIMTSP